MDCLPTRRPVVFVRQMSRRGERAHVNVPVQVMLHEQAYRGWMNDVSEHGVGIISAAALNAGDEVRVTMPLPDQPRSLTLRAIVRHTRGFHHGCQFADSQTCDRQELLQFLTAAAV